MVGQQGNEFLPFSQAGSLTSRRRSGGFGGNMQGLPGLFIVDHIMSSLQNIAADGVAIISHFS